MASLGSLLYSKTLARWRSDPGLTRKAYLNAFASALDYGSRLIVGFVTNPLLVGGLGDFGYGAWQVLGRLIAYITPASGRPSQALQWTIANRQASSDIEEKQRQVASAISVWLLFLPFLVSAGAVLAWFAPLWIHTPSHLVSAVRWAAALLGMQLVLGSLVDLPRAVLTGENLGYKRMGLSALLVFVGGGLTVLALYLHTGIMGVAAANLLGTLLSGVLFFRVARLHVPWFGIARPVRGMVRRFLGLSNWFMAWNLVMKLMRAGDVVVLGILGSAELVTTYSLTKYAPETIITLVEIVVLGIAPGLGGIIGSGDLQKAARVRNEIMAFTWLLATVMGSAILLWNRSFVELWVGTRYDAGPLTTVLIIALVAQFVLIRNDANIIDLSLNLRAKVLLGFSSAAASLIVAGVLLHFFGMGIVGVCVGFIAGRLVLSFSYPWLVGRILQVPLHAQLGGVVRPMVVTALLFAVCARLSSILEVRTWPGLVLSGGISLPLLLLPVFYTGLSEDQRGALLRRLPR